MELYLMQHGAALSEEEDINRPLSETGKAEVSKVASYAARLGIKITEIHHSPKLRAKQTADIVSKSLKTKALEMQDLKPNDDPAIVKEFAEAQTSTLMLVGHLPHLSKLASLLLGASDTIAFRMGALVCLELTDRWRVKWILTPEMVR